MTDHRYILQPYTGMNSRFVCPGCQRKDKTFSRYIDQETGEQIHPDVGRCNREINCGYHYTPSDYFRDTGNKPEHGDKYTPGSRMQKQNIPRACARQVSYIPFDIFSQSRSAYEQNNFVQWLISLLGPDKAADVITLYHIGTSKHWPGATVFWQIDTKGKIRSGKIMLYDASTGKRIKEPFNHITWAHKALKIEEFNLGQSYFGSHILKLRSGDPIALVESEKSAIVASAYFPQFIWLAVGSLTNLNDDKCKILTGRKVVLFPDLNALDKWQEKANSIESLSGCIVSDFLEQRATEEEKKQGLDICDYLVKFDHRTFKNERQQGNTTDQPQEVKQEPETVFSDKYARAKDELFDRYVRVREDNIPDTSEPPQPDDYDPQFDVDLSLFSNRLVGPSWTTEIEELEIYFNTVSIPAGPVKLNQCTTVNDPSFFLKGHLDTVKRYNGKPIFLPYLNRLREFKALFNKPIK